MDESKDDIRKRKQKEFDAKEPVPFPEKFKSDAEKLLDCREELKRLKASIKRYRQDVRAFFNKVKYIERDDA